MLFSLILAFLCNYALGGKTVIIGSGFGGLGCVKTLCESGVRDVVLLDAIDYTQPLRTTSNKPLDIGVKGFWYDYPNIYSLLENFLNLDQNDIFTKCTNSSFYSTNGLEATAPVFGDSIPLPSPLGQIFASAKLFTRLPLSDRASMVGLLYAMLDYNRDEATLEAYDRMNGHDLFIKFGLSKRLVEDFLKPTLLVGLFKPPEELSAAVIMELLYYYALAHQNSFDVKWIKQKSIPELIVNPLLTKLINEYNLTVISNARVNKLHLLDSNINSIEYIDTKSGNTMKIDEVAGCCLAIGANGLKSILLNSPEVAKVSPELARAASLNSISCISTRIWLDKKIRTRSPANVMANFEDARGAGATFFMLDELQKENLLDLWGGNTTLVDGSYPGSVIAVDFYNAEALLPLSNDEIMKIIMDRMLPKVLPDITNACILESHVYKAKDAVTWFSPGSYSKRPTVKFQSINNLVYAGDWVKLDPETESTVAKGLCQERAYVTGISAGNELVKKGLYSGIKSIKSNIIPIRKDEVQVQIGRKINKNIMNILKPFGLASPWVR